MSVDGFIYPAREGRIPDLSSHYTDGQRAWPLKGIKAAGTEFVKALVEFTE